MLPLDLPVTFSPIRCSRAVTWPDIKCVVCPAWAETNRHFSVQQLSFSPEETWQSVGSKYLFAVVGGRQSYVTAAVSLIVNQAAEAPPQHAVKFLIILSRCASLKVLRQRPSRTGAWLLWVLESQSQALFTFSCIFLLRLQLYYKKRGFFSFFTWVCGDC